VIDDVADTLAIAWKTGVGPQAPAADIHAACSLLAEEALLYGPEEDLATFSVGPFRVATTPYEEPVRDFLEVLVPSGLAVTVGGGNPWQSAASGVLTAMGTVFVKLLRRGRFFGRCSDDVDRWSTLIYIKQRNASGERPSIAEVAAALAASARGDAVPQDRVVSAVAWLKRSATDHGSDRQPLVSEDDHGKLTALV
jgi:hypothetical protein